MSDGELSGRERYQVRRKPGGLIRVVDRRKETVDGYWLQNKQKFWFVDEDGKCPECGGFDVKTEVGVTYCGDCDEVIATW